MLLGNYTSLNSNPGRAIGGFTNLFSNYKPGCWYSFYDPDTNTTRTVKAASFPAGTQPPYSWILAPGGGQLSSTTAIVGTGSITSALSGGKLMTADLSSGGDLSASMSLVTAVAAAISASGSVSASVSTSIAFAADLIGSGDFEGALSLLIPLAAEITSIGIIEGDLKGNSDLQATIYVSQAEASVQQLVAAVWSALAADYNVSGTMGQKLNGAGSAGDPWTTDLSGYNTGGTAGKILKSTLSQNNFIALK